MWDLKACTVCLSTGVKLYSLDTGTMRKDFNLVSGLQTMQGNGMPEYLCVECSAYVMKFRKFRDKCHRAHFALEQILISNKEIKKSNLKVLNRQQLKLMPALSYIDLDNTHYEQVRFKLVNYCRTSVSQLGLIPVAHYSTLTKEDTFEQEMNDINKKDSCVKTKESYVMPIENNVKPIESHAKRTESHVKSVENHVKQINSCVKVELEFPQQMDTVRESVYRTLKSDKPPTNILKKALEALNDPSLLNNTAHNDFDHDELNETFDNDVGMENEGDQSDSEDYKFKVMPCELDNKADGSSFNEEYGVMEPISVREAKAAMEVFKFTSMGDFHCKCGKRFASERSIQQHSRRHDPHISGSFHCEICNYYFKTDFLLQCHMTDQHMYKYLCKKCPEVSFTKPSAKRHYVWEHIQEGSSGSRWDVVKRPTWLKTKRLIKSTLTPPKKMPKKLPKDFPLYTPIPQEEQYLLVQQRKESRNYLEAKFKCELCFRGYRLTSTYNKHMAKHDPVLSGHHQCDMCKHYFRDTRKLYKHMMMYHLFKYSCRYCDFVSTNKGQALYHYRWHKNVTYDCPHCGKKFMKISTQLTHIRFKHPSTDICNLCGHSFVSSSGLHYHKQMSHTKEEMEISEAMTLNPVPTEPNFCSDCNMQFLNVQAYMTHLGSSRKHVGTNLSVINNQRLARRTERRLKRECAEGAAPRRGRPRADAAASEVLHTGTTTATTCEVCGKYLVSDVVARKHYEAEHPGTDYLKRYMCDVCGHTTKQYANLLVHMRVHTLEKPYGCPHCDRRFSMPSNRDRHLVVHTGEKRYQCQHCSRRFTQSTAVKLHIQTVHMKIPYKPWDKKNRKRRKDCEPTTTGLDLPASSVALAVQNAPQHKLLLDPTAESYITYISYADEQ